jgi:uncharacterized peroxidase-related enzyme
MNRMRSFVHSPDLTEEEFPPFAALRKSAGFIPNFYKAQTGRTDLIVAQMAWVGSAMVKAGALERRQKEYIFLAVSARNLSTYCATAHCEIVRMLKIEGPEPEQIAIDHSLTSIPLADKALLNFVVKLNNQPAQICQADIDTLRTFGFSDQHILEAIVMTGVAQFANTANFGLGTTPDFKNDRVDFSVRR